MESSDHEDRPVERPWRRILCAVDFSESSREAVAIAADLARRVGAEITLVHVTERGPRDEAAALEVQRGLARAALAARQYVDEVRTLVLAGDPAEEILSFAEGGGSDLVVMGTRGRKPVSRLVLGSVALAVVSRARCPVLVARCEPRGPA